MFCISDASPCIAGGICFLVKQECKDVYSFAPREINFIEEAGP